MGVAVFVCFMTNRFNLPFLGFGAGLRTDHYPDIIDQWPAIDWFEILSENFMDSDGQPRRKLEAVREHYPIVMHGVSLSIGSTDPLNIPYLDSLKNLAAWVEPAWISDHLCWTGINHITSHDLLPIPYTEEALKHIITRIKQVQDILERPLILENPSTYLEFHASSIPEWEFIAAMAKESGCGLLVDVNNIYVSCYNHQLDAKTYIDALPNDHIVQVHLAGHENNGSHIIDTHSDHVIDEVWELYQYLISQTGHISTMVEWDDNIPEFSVLLAEIDTAKQYAIRAVNASTHSSTLSNHTPATHQPTALSDSFETLMERMQSTILTADLETSNPAEWVKAKPGFAPEEQMQIYVNGYRLRLHEVLCNEYEVTGHFLGHDAMDKLVYRYIEHTPSSFTNITHYVLDFPEYIKQDSTLGNNPVQQQQAYELARLERILTELFDETETPPLDAESVAALPPEAFMEKTIKPRKAFTLMTFAYDVNSYLDHYHDNNPINAPKAITNYLAVHRHDDVLWRTPVDAYEHDFLSCLQNHPSVGQAMEAFILKHNETILAEHLQAWFAKWVHHGMLQDVA